MAAVQENPDTDFVAAISGDRRRGGGAARGKTRGGGRGRGGKAAPRLPEPEASKEARLAAVLCIKHWRYGEAASSCEQEASKEARLAAGIRFKHWRYGDAVSSCTPPCIWHTSPS
jgi:hypothetical protein